MSRYRLSAEASADIRAIKRYLTEERGKDVAQRTVKRVREGCAFVARNPHIGHLREDLTDRPVRFWTVPPYVIIYKAETRPIEVTRVFHGAQDIKRRLAEGP